MTQEDFDKLVTETLLTEGETKLGHWSLQTQGDDAIITVQLNVLYEKIGINATLQCSTENSREPIRTAIIAIAEIIRNNTDKFIADKTKK